jgi:RimJ/RimL family protein N-acetyltransferase
VRDAGAVHVNEFGQRVGRPVPGWEPRPPFTPVTLVGRTCRVEPLTEAHYDGLHRAINLESPATVWSYYPAGPYDSDDMHARLDGLFDLPAAAPFAVVVDDAPLGITCFLRIDPPQGSIEIGSIVLGAALARTTASTEATALMLRHAFDDLGYRRFEWKCDSENAPSVAAATRFGFTYEGRFRNAMVYRGRNRDTDWFSITDEEWARLRPAYDAWLDPENFDGDGRQRRTLQECRTSNIRDTDPR